MAITPDTKDWTWVLERTCEECNFDARSFPREQIPSMIRTVARDWRKVLVHPDVRERPRDEMWSPLEYACHVRDVFELYDERLQMMLQEDDPLYPNWDQDATAVEKDYGGQDPQHVAEQLTASGESLAARFETVSDDHRWNRVGRRSDGARFTIESFGRYFIHDPIHHLHDVRHLKR